MTNPVNNIVNLNRVRKQKKRADDKKKAAENRMKFGRTQAEKKKDATAQDDFVRHGGEHKGEAD